MTNNEPQQKVTVIGTGGEKIGTTYPKRARGLVKKGRALFVSDFVIRLTDSPTYSNSCNTEELPMDSIKNFFAKHQDNSASTPSAENGGSVMVPNLTVTSGSDGTISLTWIAVDGASGYDVSVSDAESGGDSFKLMDTFEGTSAVIGGLEPNKAYNISVTAVFKAKARVPSFSAPDSAVSPVSPVTPIAPVVPIAPIAPIDSKTAPEVPSENEVKSAEDGWPNAGSGSGIWYSTKRIKEDEARKKTDWRTDWRFGGGISTDNIADCIDMDELAEKVAELLDTSEISEHLSLGAESIAEELDIDEIVESLAGELDADKIAESLAERIDMKSLASGVAENVDMDDLAEHLAESLDADKLIKALAKHLKD